MANSLRAKLSKLRHDGHITDAEYQAFIKKMDGHDMEIYALGYNQGTIDRAEELQKCREYGYNKAIDEYMNALCDKCLDMKNECYQLECPFCGDGCDIVNIAEQMKGGGK
jgi:hypothetical protein